LPCFGRRSVFSPVRAFPFLTFYPFPSASLVSERCFLYADPSCAGRVVSPETLLCRHFPGLVDSPFFLVFAGGCFLFSKGFAPLSLRMRLHPLARSLLTGFRDDGPLLIMPTRSFFLMDLRDGRQFVPGPYSSPSSSTVTEDLFNLFLIMLSPRDLPLSPIAPRPRGPL